MLDRYSSLSVILRCKQTLWRAKTSSIRRAWFDPHDIQDEFDESVWEIEYGGDGGGTNGYVCCV